MFGGALVWRPGRCPVCGGLFSEFYYFEKEVFENPPLLPAEECNCGRLEAMREAMNRVFSLSRAAALEAFRAEVKRQGGKVE